MQITSRWSEVHGEARLSPSERKALLERRGDLAALDFLNDTINELQALYNDLLPLLIPRPHKHDEGNRP